MENSTDWMVHMSHICACTVAAVIPTPPTAILSGNGIASAILSRIPPNDNRKKNNPDIKTIRSEERRVGKECLRLCRSRWSPYH